MNSAEIYFRAFIYTVPVRINSHAIDLLANIFANGINKMLSILCVKKVDSISRKVRKGYCKEH